MDKSIQSIMLGTSSIRQYKERKEVVKRSMNKHEWTRGLDSVLMQSVIRNYFNFQVVAQERPKDTKNLQEVPKEAQASLERDPERHPGGDTSNFGDLKPPH